VTSDVFDIVIIHIIQAEAAKRGRLSIWTVYNRPRDYPTGWVARMFEVGGAELKPTGHVIKCMDPDPIREKLTRARLTVLPRQDGDDAEIVESWI
jgi:hypothetical protein